MRLIDQYQRLHQNLPACPAPDMHAIADMLCCSVRNARLLLGQMEAFGWIRRIPGRGRGRRTQIDLLKEPSALRLQHIRSRIEAGKLDTAFLETVPRARLDALGMLLSTCIDASSGTVLRMPFHRSLTSLDPLQANRRPELHILRQVGCGLVEYDEQLHQLRPALAHRWTHDAAGIHWSFNVRPGLHFHDGRRIRTRDIVSTLERARITEGPHRQSFAHIETIGSTQDTIHLLLSRPDHLLPNLLASCAGMVVPEDDWLRADFSQRPVSAGAFRIERNTPWQARLSRFDGYFRERTLLDQVELWFLEASNTLPAMHARQFDSHFRALPDQAIPPDWQLLQQPELGCDFAILNPASPIFASLESRQAFAHLLRQSVIPLSVMTQRPLAQGFLPDWLHVEDRQTGARLTPATLHMISPKQDGSQQLAEHLAATLRDKGYRIVLSLLDYDDFHGQQAWHQSDIAIGYELVLDDIRFGLRDILNGNSMLHAWLSADQRANLQRSVMAASGTSRIEDQHQLLEQAFRQLTAEASMIPLLHTRQYAVAPPQMNGLCLNASGWLDFRRIWFDSAP
ncbi:SgrR family transcriptional regulator [Burkholderiaceae bacterium DAT-1]|nr:SgrR family transcriptional regulator [Burkholderiaceae bacterium DAT-1]